MSDRCSVVVVMARSRGLTVDSKFAHVDQNSDVYPNSTSGTQTQPRIPKIRPGILNLDRVYSHSAQPGSTVSPQLVWDHTQPGVTVSRDCPT